MRNNHLDWNNDSVNSDPWLNNSFNTRNDDQNNFFTAIQQISALTQLRPQENHISRADSLEFADQYRSLSYNLLNQSTDPLSTSQLHSLLFSTNPNLVELLDQRKSTSCMAKLLTEDPKKRFNRFTSSILRKSNTYFGIKNKEYDLNIWIPKLYIEKSSEQSHKSDLETTESLREYVKNLLITRGNKPISCNEIIEIIKQTNNELSNIIFQKNKNYIVKTLRRDPKKRFLFLKGDGGILSFHLSL